MTIAELLVKGQGSFDLINGWCSRENSLEGKKAREFISPKTLLDQENRGRKIIHVAWAVVITFVITTGTLFLQKEVSFASTTIQFLYLGIILFTPSAFILSVKLSGDANRFLRDYSELEEVYGFLISSSLTVSGDLSERAKVSIRNRLFHLIASEKNGTLSEDARKLREEIAVHHAIYYKFNLIQMSLPEMEYDFRRESESDLVSA